MYAAKVVDVPLHNRHLVLYDSAPVTTSYLPLLVPLC
jgi:hypothetical protein